MGVADSYQTQNNPDTKISETETIPGGVLNKKVFGRIRSWPIWGGPWSYLVVETDPQQELECIRSFGVAATPDQRIAVLRCYLPKDSPFPDNLREMIVALQVSFPPGEEDVAARKKRNREILSAKEKYGGTEAEFEAEQQKGLMVFDWERILRVVPREAKDMLAAWNRLERDQVYREIDQLNYLSSVTRWYINSNVVEIAQQEDRWRGKASMGFLERMLFWFWNLLMLLGVIIPDVINFTLTALLAVIRSLPTRPQGLAMVTAIMDFPFADERLARLTLFQRFLGALVTVIFGIKAAFYPKYHAIAFRGIGQLWWKALLAVFWQVAMQNWKNVLDIVMRTLVQLKRLSDDQIKEVKEKEESLELCNAYSFAWFETYNQGNRFRAQVSYHKQDQGDISTALSWAARFTLHSIPNEDFFSKFSTWIATTVIGGLICASTFPVDPYAGLIALAYYANIIAKMGLDVWDSSQSYGDVLRFFTATVGPTFPATVVLIVNLIWWIVKHTGLFKSVSIAFWIVLAVLFIASLYPKLWGEMFMRLGLLLRNRFVKKPDSSNVELPEP